MEKEEHGLLFVEQEETEKTLKRLREKLITLGGLLTNLGNALTKNPADVVFANAPSGLGDIPLKLMHSPSFDWNTLPDKETIARLIKELREVEDRLETVSRKLTSQ